MPKKTKRVVKPITAATRAEDERLRKLLRNADLKTLDKALEKAVRTGRGSI